MSPRPVVVVDGANVVGSRPDGWWKDRAGAARRLHESLLVADLGELVVLVLEGQAKAGVRAGRDADVRVVHARGDGDEAIVAEVRRLRDAGDRVTVVTADRMLRARVEQLGAVTAGPSWLFGELEG
ncbi:MAG: hypothetical protein ACR2K3_09465 [Nocardioides sp.]